MDMKNANLRNNLSCFAAFMGLNSGIGPGVGRTHSSALPDRAACGR